MPAQAAQRRGEERRGKEGEEGRGEERRGEDSVHTADKRCSELAPGRNAQPGLWHRATWNPNLATTKKTTTACLLSHTVLLPSAGTKREGGREVERERDRKVRETDSHI